MRWANNLTGAEAGELSDDHARTGWFTWRAGKGRPLHPGGAEPLTGGMTVIANFVEFQGIVTDRAHP